MKFKTFIVAIAAVCCTSCVGVTDKAMEMADSIMDKTITRTIEEGEFNKFYDISNFNSIDAEGFCHIIYTQSENYSVKVSTNYAELLDALKADKSGKKLKLKMKKKQSLNMDDPFINVYVKAPVINKLELAGACGMTCDKMAVDSDLEISVSGAGSIQLGTVECKSLKINASGAIKMAGTYLVKNDVNWESSGAAILDVNITADKIRFENSGAVKMDAKVDCNKLKAINSGAGVMNLKGKAKKTEFEKAGASRINTDGLN